MQVVKHIDRSPATPSASSTGENKPPAVADNLKTAEQSSHNTGITGEGKNPKTAADARLTPDKTRHSSRQTVTGESTKEEHQEFLNAGTEPLAGSKSEHEGRIVALAGKPPSVAASVPSPTRASSQTAEYHVPSTKKEPSTAGSKSVASALGTAPTTPRPAEPSSSPTGIAPSGTPVIVPASYSLESGTRLWIKLNSVDRNLNGTFTFRGALLEPVTQADAVLLAQGTEVVGSGTQSGGKTSLRIVELVVGGAHYRLRINAGTANVRASGTGPAVEFDLGKVLETWLASASVFEKIPDRPNRDLKPQTPK